jgi:hypothetical protein
MTKQLIIDEAFIEKLKQQRNEALMIKEKEAYEYMTKLRFDIYNLIDSASKQGDNSILIFSTFKLSQEFEYSIQPLTLNYMGEKTMDSPVSEGRKIVLGYEYQISFNL